MPPLCYKCKEEEVEEVDPRFKRPEDAVCRTCFLRAFGILKRRRAIARMSK